MMGLPPGAEAPGCSKFALSGRGRGQAPPLRTESSFVRCSKLGRWAHGGVMGKGRLEAFSDGVLAIIITIMVLELHAPHDATWEALSHALPSLIGYLLSFIYVGIYWNNHHHMFQAAKHVSGGALWANLHLLFWLSLVPFTTGWMTET